MSRGGGRQLGAESGVLGVVVEVAFQAAILAVTVAHWTVRHFDEPVMTAIVLVSGLDCHRFHVKPPWPKELWSLRHFSTDEAKITILRAHFASLRFSYRRKYCE
jgi:hypothetical protein